MKNIIAEILTADKTNMTNEKTGEITTMTKIMYRIETADTEIHTGPAIFECYKVGDFVEKLKPFCKIGKVCHVDIDQRPTKNGSKFVLTKIENIEL